MNSIPLYTILDMIFIIYALPRFVSFHKAPNSFLKFSLMERETNIFINRIPDVVRKTTGWSNVLGLLISILRRVVGIGFLINIGSLKGYLLMVWITWAEKILERGSHNLFERAFFKENVAPRGPKFGIP